VAPIRISLERGAGNPRAEAWCRSGSAAREFQLPDRSAAMRGCTCKGIRVMAAVKKHLERTLEKQAAKADADITKNTKGDADAGLQDITTAGVNETNQPQPCTPVAKGKGPTK